MEMQLKIVNDCKTIGHSGYIKQNEQSFVFLFLFVLCDWVSDVFLFLMKFLFGIF